MSGFARSIAVPTMPNADWQGDLDDDCWLQRYGLFAHVEKMDRNWWWFAVSRGREIGAQQLYNHADRGTSVDLKSGDIARIAAECVMEALRQSGHADE